MSWFSRFLPRPKLAPGSGIPRVDLMRASGPMSEALKASGHVVTAEFVGNSNSMIPAMDNNAVVLLEYCKFESLKLGDIVTYHAGEGRTIHALVERRPGGWIAKGYNNSQDDPMLVTPITFVARVCGVLHGTKAADTDI